MAKERDRRYPDAAAFGEDLRRILRYEAVAARGRSVWSAVGRRLRRHRMVVAALAIVLAIVVSQVVLAVRLVSAERAAAEALRALARADLAARFGRVDEWRAAGDLALAAAEVEKLTVEVPEELRAEAAAAERAVVDAIDGVLAAAEAVVADAAAPRERIDGAIAVLAPARGVAHRGEDIERAHDALAARIRAAGEAAPFRSPDLDVRLRAVESWTQSRRKGRPIEPARAAAVAELLATETEEEVLLAALSAAVRFGFAEHAEVLRARVVRGDRRHGLVIVLAAALAGQRDWLALHRAHAPQWVAADYDYRLWSWGRERAGDRAFFAEDGPLGMLRTDPAFLRGRRRRDADARGGAPPSRRP